MFRLQELIRRDMKKLADNVTQENGKTLADSEGDVLRGLQVWVINFFGSLKYFYNLNFFKFLKMTNLV